MARNIPVDLFLDTLVHARKPEILALRAAILHSNPEITERIKWNAPSFCRDGEDRVTMRLQPGDRLQLVFHRGAKPRATDDFAFDDPTGRIEWAAADRGVLTIANASAGELEEVVSLVNSWLGHD